jgi:hypothetical protein
MTLKISTAILATVTLIGVAAVCYFAPRSYAQLPDKTVTPNSANVGINKSFAEQAGAGQGDVMTLDSSVFVIKRDPFRAIRRGRQIFQRKYTKAQGMGPLSGDGIGEH